jgi:cytochrome b561
MPVVSRYSNLSIAFHWIIALLIVAAFALGSVMTDMKISPTKLQYYSWHKWLGVTVLGLAALRLLTRLLSAAPAHPEHLPAWQKKAASTTHVILYVLMFAVPLSGYFYTSAAGFPVVYLGMFPLPTIIDPNPELKETLKKLHEILTSVLFAFVALHVAAALKHQFIDKDGLLKRMWVGK